MHARATLEALLARPGLAASERLPVLLQAALAYPDLDLLVQGSRLALARGLDAAALREVCRQGIAYAGFPRALAAFEALASVLPPAEPDEAPPADAVHGHGWNHFATVYGEKCSKLHQRLVALDPLFARLTIEVAYGTLLARPHLSGKTRELMGVAALSVLDQPRQMLAHAHGARNFGASRDEVVETAATVAACFSGVATRRHVDFLRHELGD